MSPHGLPPLKFYTGFLKPHSVLAPRLDQNVDYEDEDGNESVASVSDNMDTNSDNEEDYDDNDDLRSSGVDFSEKNPVERIFYSEEEEDEEVLDYNNGCGIKLNKGLMNNLKIEVPNCGNRRFTDGDSVAYDACIRLCLYALAKGCKEAPEFLRDECLVLRSAFG
ncbi:hypothetical protein Dsin_031891 [Dipteronia sinensis]|uniref:Uncharacterized protein n=1 Tax=Dipteronia sinensis TaxID=43782 RepID=A0AAD9ZN95_9ROSI|nr:hypothetical protein Dsin_031891 [Dipteronia sinensis]